MLRIYGSDKNGEFRNLPYINSIVLKRDGDTPCDMLEVVVGSDVGFEVCFVYLEEDGDVFFRGIVDEQITDFGTKVTTKLVARSEEALLTDNEACPEIFINPVWELIFSRYARPLGITGYELVNKVLKGTLKVSKGMSCYEVLSGFCKQVYGKSPYVKDGVLRLFGEAQELVFATEGTEGIRVKEACVKSLNCKLISAVNVKTSPDGGYITQICDDEVADAGICRQRYLDVSALSVKDYSEAVELIRRSKLKSFELSLVCDGRFTDILGKSARAEIFGRSYEGLVVSGVRYTRNNRKNETLVTLVKRSV